MRPLVFLTGLAAAVTAATLSLLPPRASVLEDVHAIPRHVRGVMHVHSRISDGSGTVEQIAAAAARAGLDFLVLTDHGNAIRFPERPAYRDGVLVIEAVEISTERGHVIALGLEEGAPYPLGGEPHAALEDISRAGGFSVVAHPTSGRTSIEWNEWDALFDAFEWLNADSEWRDESAASLARALFTYPWRRPEVLGSLLDRPDELLSRWDQLTTTRPVIALAGADAHANLGFSEASNRYGDRAMLALPAYEQVFRTFSVALPAASLSGDATSDSREVIRQIREGRVYTAIDAFAGPARLSFTATAGSRTAGPGQRLDTQRSVTFDVRSTAPADARVRLLKDGTIVAEQRGADLQYVASPDRGAYRVEVDLSSARTDAAPWLLSNPIYVNGWSEPPRMPRRPIDTVVRYADGPVGPDIDVEKNDASKAVFEVAPVVNGTRLRVRYALGASSDSPAYVALRMGAGEDLSRFDRIVFDAGADKPMRISVQLRIRTATGNVYWRRSVYLDHRTREMVVKFADLVPVADAPPVPPLSEIEAVLFVVDPTHTPLGSAGSFWIDEVRFGRERGTVEGGAGRTAGNPTDQVRTVSRR
jgi:hypothetical protein